MSPSSNKPPACPRTPWTISDYLQMFLVDQSCENCASLARSVTRFSSTEVGCFICLLRIRVHGNRFADKLGTLRTLSSHDWSAVSAVCITIIVFLCLLGEHATRPVHARPIITCSIDSKPWRPLSILSHLSSVYFSSHVASDKSSPVNSFKTVYGKAFRFFANFQKFA